jgi:hypothetical protein
MKSESGAVAHSGGILGTRGAYECLPAAGNGSWAPCGAEGRFCQTGSLSLVSIGKGERGPDLFEARRVLPLA